MFARTEVDMKLSQIDTLKLLVVLITSPYIFSYLDEAIADSLEDAGLFDLDTFEVTPAGFAIVNSPAVA